MSGYALPNGTEPTIFLDFKNGVYTASGVAVAVGDLLTQNVDWGNWNAALIVHGTGLTGGNNANPVFTGAAFALAAAGSTTLLVFTKTGSENSIRYEMVDDLNEYNTDYFCRLSFDPLASSQISDGSTSNNTEWMLAGGLHQAALTMISGKIARSIDGSTPISINPALSWLGIEPTVLGFIVPTGCVIESIGIYPPQADGDLAGLTANGFPILTAPPVISGTAQVGETVSVTTGTWDSANSFAYQWYAFGNVIPSATASTYLIASDYEGATLSCLVSATNATGTSIARVVDDDTVIAA